MNIQEVKLNLLRRCNFPSQLVDKSSSGTATQLDDELRSSSGTASELCPSLEVALENLENALKKRARDPDPSKPPVVWAPPNLRAPKNDETAGVSELKFVKMNLEESAKTHPSDGELLEAIVTFESFWEMNSKMFKAMVLQRKMVNFLAACARTDGYRFSKMILERTRDSPAEVPATVSDPERAAALDAVKKNNKKRGKKNDKKGEEQDDALMEAKARLEHNVEVRVSAGGKKG